MSIVEILLLGAALSADAMSVTLCNMMAWPHMQRSRAIAQPVAFGLFQGIMPAAGFVLGSLASGLIGRVAGPITFIILGAIGAKMAWDGLHSNAEQEAEIEGSATSTLGWGALAAQAIATSIDAFAVGVSLAATGENIIVCSILIALCTCVLCAIMLVIGRRLGAHFGSRAQIAGGIVLIALGIKAIVL